MVSDSLDGTDRSSIAIPDADQGRAIGKYCGQEVDVFWYSKFAVR